MRKALLLLAVASVGATTLVAHAATSTTTPVLAAAPTSLTAGQFTSLSCSSDPAFAANSCDQCFQGTTVKVGDRLTGLFDNWTNSTSNLLIAYKDEQKTPNMVPFGSSVWVASPSDETKLWKNSSDVVWTTTGSGSRLSYILTPGQTIRFVESDLGAGYTLTKTDRKNGDKVGMLRYPVVAHAIDAAAGGTEGAANTHYECVAYTLSAPAPVTPAPTVTPPAPVKPAPVTPSITKTQTGPETIVLIVAAFFISFGLMFSLRKRI